MVYKYCVSLRNFLQWRPIQMGAFPSNENGLFSTHPLSDAPLFGWKERGKQEALIGMENSYLNRTPQYLNVIRQVWVRFCQVVSDHFLDEDISKGLEVLGEATCGPICFLFL